MEEELEETSLRHRSAASRHHHQRRRAKKPPPTTNYDDVFGGPPRHAVPFSGVPDDYSEVFGGVSVSCSIPFLDLPTAQMDGWDCASGDSVNGVDYREIFGRCDFADFAVPYEELFGRENRDEGDIDMHFSPANGRSSVKGRFGPQIIDPSAFIQEYSSEDNIPYLDDLDFSVSSSEIPKEYNTSYNKSSRAPAKELLHTPASVSQPQTGFTFVVEPNKPLPEHLPVVTGDKSSDENSVKPSPRSSANSQSISNREPVPLEVPFLNVTGVNLRAQSANLPPPAPKFVLNERQKTNTFPKTDSVSNFSTEAEQPQQEKPKTFLKSDSLPTNFDFVPNLKLDKREKPKLKSRPNTFSKSESLPPGFGSELDAIKEAMEFAQARLKTAKELHEKRREGKITELPLKKKHFKEENLEGSEREKPRVLRSISLASNFSKSREFMKVQGEVVAAQSTREWEKSGKWRSDVEFHELTSIVPTKEREDKVGSTGTESLAEANREAMKINGLPWTEVGLSGHSNVDVNITENLELAEEVKYGDSLKREEKTTIESFEILTQSQELVIEIEKEAGENDTEAWKEDDNVNPNVEERENAEELETETGSKMKFGTGTEEEDSSRMDGEIKRQRKKEELEKESQREKEMKEEEEKETARKLEEEKERAHQLEEEKERAHKLEEEKERKCILEEENERRRALEEKERKCMLEEEKERKCILEEENERRCILEKEKERKRLLEEEKERKLQMEKEREEKERKERERIVAEEKERLEKEREEKLINLAEERERERKLEEERKEEKIREMEMVRKLEEEKKRERKLEEEIEKEREKVRMLEEEREHERERVRELEEEKQREREMAQKLEKDKERERKLEEEIEKERERIRKLEEERELEREKVRKLEEERELERERVRKLEEEREQERERVRKLEEEREKERIEKEREQKEREKMEQEKEQRERERILKEREQKEMEKKLEEEKQRMEKEKEEIEKWRRIEKEREEKEVAMRLEAERRRLERERAEEMERMAKLQREKEKDRKTDSRKSDEEREHDRQMEEKDRKTEGRKSDEEREKVRERKSDEERERRARKDRGIEEREREEERKREREKDRLAMERATQERAERIAIERITAARQRAVENREKEEMNHRGGGEVLDKRRPKGEDEKKERDGERNAREARQRAERAAVERATAEARERAIEKAKAEAEKGRDRLERYKSFNRISSQDHTQESHFKRTQSDSALSQGHGESALRHKARLERQQRTAERAAKALAEKNRRDIMAQREQAERDRIAEHLDAEVKRWSLGKEGNLRALLSTLQYILGQNSGWQPIHLTEVITAADVKKAYRKATLYVHPDKLQQRGASIQQKYICEKVFDLLKEAWNKYNSEER